MRMSFQKLNIKHTKNKLRSYKMSKHGFDFEKREGKDGKYPTASITFNDAVVAFAQITGAGKKGKGKENQYLVGIEFTQKQMKAFTKELEGLWEDGGLGKFNPEYDPATWLTQENEKAPWVLWLSEKVEQVDVDNFYERAEGTDFGKKHFEKLGAGSIINLGARAFLWNNENGKGVSIVPTVVHLKEFTKYSGGNASLGGTKVDMSGEGVNTKSEKKKKKGKKKKK